MKYFTLSHSVSVITSSVIHKMIQKNGAKFKTYHDGVILVQVRRSDPKMETVKKYRVSKKVHWLNNANFVCGE